MKAPADNKGAPVLQKVILGKHVLFFCQTQVHHVCTSMCVPLSVVVVQLVVVMNAANKQVVFAQYQSDKICMFEYNTGYINRHLTQPLTLTQA